MVSGCFVVYVNIRSSLEKQTYMCIYSDDVIKLLANLRTASQWTQRKGGRGCRNKATIRTGFAAIKTHFFYQPFYANGEDQVLNQTSRLLFYFSSSPLPCFSAQTFRVLSLYPCTILLLLFPRSCHSSSLLPLCACSSTDMIEWPSGPQGSSDTRSLAGHLCWLADL